MKTLRQEIEKLRDNLQKDETLIGDHLAISLTDILSRTEEPTDPSQRERIATAIMQAISGRSRMKTEAELAAEAVQLTDALIEELNKNEKSKELNSSDTKSRFDSDLFISNVCSSYIHDFGLMTEDDQQKLRFECKEWMRAIQNNWDHFKY